MRVDKETSTGAPATPRSSRPADAGASGSSAQSGLGQADLGAVVAAAYPGVRTSIEAVRRLSAGASRMTLLLLTTVDGESVDLVLQVDVSAAAPGGTSPAPVGRRDDEGVEQHAAGRGDPGRTGDPGDPGDPDRRAASSAAGPATGDPNESTIGVDVQGALMSLLAPTAVPVPRLLLAEGGALLGAPLLLTARVEGETIPRRILRDPSLEVAREGFAAQCGSILAALHSVDAAGLHLSRRDALATLRSNLDWAQEPRPAFEMAYCWLVEHRPTRGADVLVHGDFRNGNLVVGPDGIRAVLDWELAHLGDPLEDIGWLCSTAWRFGAVLPVGGMGLREDLYAAYEAAGGRHIDPSAGLWWETLAALSWGAICMRQARRHLHGLTRSVELAAIGRRVCETEWDLLGLLGMTGSVAANGAAGGSLSSGGGDPGDPSPSGGTGQGRAEQGRAEQGWAEQDGVGGRSGSDVTGGQHGRPTAAELVESVREFLAEGLGPVVPDDQRFHLRVATRVLATVERELALGPGQAAAHGARLDALGYPDDQTLAVAIRAGLVDPGRRAAVEAAVVADVEDRLAVANPAYIEQ